MLRACRGVDCGAASAAAAILGGAGLSVDILVYHWAFRLRLHDDPSKKHVHLIAAARHMQGTGVSKTVIVRRWCCE